MDHKQLEEKIWAAYDGALSAQDRALADAHAQACDSCRAMLDHWTQTRRRYLEPLRVSRSPAFVQAVMRRVRTLELPETGFQRFLAHWAVPALAFSVASFAASLLYVRTPGIASTDTMLWADRSSNTTAQWLANHPNEDQIISSLVANP